MEGHAAALNMGAGRVHYKLRRRYFARRSAGNWKFLSVSSAIACLRLFTVPFLRRSRARFTSLPALREYLAMDPPLEVSPCNARCSGGCRRVVRLDLSSPLDRPAGGKWARRARS